MAVLLISDLHLDAGRPETIDRFLSFVERDALGAEQLYILGDLFEAWIGDDDCDHQMKPVIEALRKLHKAGIPCSIMHGNRDFLLGRRFELATGCRLIGNDFDVVELHGERVLLTHGDLLCTDDERYQKLRHIVRDPDWQKGFLAKPLQERRAIADQLRDVSRNDTAGKSEEIMDVNPDAVEDAMRRYDVRYLLHGHTHRPAVHDIPVDGAPGKRIVLGAWHDRGYVVRWDAEGFRLETC